MDINEQCALDTNGNLKDAADIDWLHSPTQTEHALPSVIPLAATHPIIHPVNAVTHPVNHPQSAFTFRFSVPLNSPNINVTTAKASANNTKATTNTSGQRKTIAATQIRKQQPITLAKPAAKARNFSMKAAKPKGSLKRPVVDRLLSESTSACDSVAATAVGSQANSTSTAASEKSDDESQVTQVEQGHRRKRRNSAPGDGGKDVLTLFTAVDADDTNEGYTCAGCMYVFYFLTY